MDAFDGVMLILHCSGDAKLGRRAIQRIIYLVGRKIPSLSVPPYRMQYYGPFSEELGHVLEKLVSFSFVSEEKTPGGQQEAYGYSLTADGAGMVRQMAGAPEYQQIRSLVDTCRTACGFRLGALSYASKILYLLEDGLPYREAVERVENSGWKRYPGSVKEGTRILEELGLADA